MVNLTLRPILRGKGLWYPTFGQYAILIFIPLLLLEYAGEAW